MAIGIGKEKVFFSGSFYAQCKCKFFVTPKSFIVSYFYKAYIVVLLFECLKKIKSFITRRIIYQYNLKIRIILLCQKWYEPLNVFSFVFSANYYRDRYALRITGLGFCECKFGINTQ